MTLYGAEIGSPWVDRQLAFWSPGWVVGGCLVSVLAAFCLRRRVARTAAMPSWAAAAMIIWLGAVLSWTLSPRSPGDRYFVFDVTGRACTLWRNDVAFTATTVEWQSNLLLFAPLGALIALSGVRRRRAALLGIIALVPVFIEAARYAVADLNRVCSGTDVTTNWLGLVGAYAVARLALRTRRARGGPRGERRRRSRTSAEPGERSSDVQV